MGEAGGVGVRIAIDARILNQPTTGVGRYTRQLIRGLAAMDRENEYFLLFDGEPPRWLPQEGNFRAVASRKRLPFPGAWAQLELPWLLKGLKVEVFHCPRNWEFPFWKTCRLVVTVHDLIPWLFPPQAASRREALYYQYYRLSTRLLPRLADAVLTDSQHSKGDLMRALGLPEEKIAVAYPAPDPVFGPWVDESYQERVRAKYGLRRPFFLHLGGIDDHKNTGRLLRAFALLLGRHPELEHLLAVVGRREWCAGRWGRWAEELGLAGRVVFTGLVADEELAALYAGADFFLYPSLYEGFGLPALEAMACGAPVMAARVSALPEVLADAALFVDPWDVEGMAEALYQVVADGGLREELRRRGLARSGLFQQEALAQRAVQVYAGVCFGPSRPAEVAGRKG